MNGNFDQIAVKLIGSGKLESEKYDEAKALAKKESKSVEMILMKKDWVKDEDVGAARASLLKIPFIRLMDKVIADEVINVLPYSVAAAQKVIVFGRDDKKILVAMAEPENLEIINFLEKKTGLEPEVYFATNHDLNYALSIYTRDINKRFEGVLKEVVKNPHHIESLKEVSKILDTLITFANQSKASDIHLEPYAEYLLVRYRIDGILHDITTLPRTVESLITTRIKVLSGMRTDEHQAAQDGRFKFNADGEEITVRVSIIPIYYGEKTVMRVLSSKPQHLDLKNLGYSDSDYLKVKEASHKTHGMILVTGPTGSGKTTTLYTVLQMLNSREVNISTIEDPIEYNLQGINQIQVNNKTKLTFSNGLRAILRQDPDVVMVGEIRDEETANIAVNAALTGHLVLATLHTNNAALTLPRLLEMGIEAFLVGSTVNIVIAQRLVRTLCVNCRETYVLNKEEVKDLREMMPKGLNFDETLKSNTNQSEQIELFRSVGCEKCHFMQFIGRSCICETLVVNERIKKLILEKAHASEIETAAVEEGMISLLQDGLEKVRQGVTTLTELFRVVRE